MPLPGERKLSKVVKTLPLHEPLSYESSLRLSDLPILVRLLKRYPHPSNSRFPVGQLVHQWECLRPHQPSHPISHRLLPRFLLNRPV